ncbi:glycosyltransferase [Candidatus Williamhamiltonella defendens]|uniref:Uncharacterized protein n=1 Tax=Candidatus Hamiltonella defensa (Bemisia tabaci) TaxID=672795 RepID=A0A249DZ12_9ENTR|nr:glycosyltransferase [Candidatus Hamiltonella defensa]ASX26340.1 hypothetical protein BA171_04475 [Candidatus Hamiltonella defensa (Bemisia tabaci)]CED79658.1 Glycosyl transferase group 1 [Candidatus Hamiltonella defensa (Bemisia tabaci)]
MKKIIRLCPFYYPDFKYGGSVIADYELDKSLVQAGHRVEVITCKKNLSKITIEKNSGQHIINYFPVIKFPTYAISIKALILLFKKIRAEKNNIDYVFFSGIWNLFTIFGPLICQFFDIKYVMVPHGSLTSKLLKLKSNFSKRFVTMFFIKRNIKLAYKTHFASEYEKNEAQSYLGINIKSFIYPWSFDLNKFKFEENIINSFYTKYNGHDKIIISFIGRISKEKRLDLVLESLKILPDVIKNKILFLIVGPDEENIWSKALSYRANTGVETNFIGPLYNNDLAVVYNLTDIFILTSESENFAISVIEAAYCSCALLLSKFIGVSSYFNSPDAALYCDLEINDIAQKISSLITDNNKLNKYKYEARLQSKRFDSSRFDAAYFFKKISKII